MGETLSERGAGGVGEYIFARNYFPRLLFAKERDCQSLRPRIKVFDLFSRGGWGVRARCDLRACQKKKTRTLGIFVLRFWHGEKSFNFL
jgi:hypothetical protein